MPISDPRDISGLVLWYSAEAETAYSNGASMTGWTDLSGNGNHATAQGTLAPQWESATGEAGGPAVRFRGTHGTTSATWGYFSLPASVMGSAAAGEIHASIKSDGQNCSLWGLGLTTGTSAASHYPFTSAIYEGFGTNSRKTVGFAEVAITDWRRYNVWSAAGDWAARIDAFVEFSTGSNTVLWDAAPVIGHGKRNGALSDNTGSFQGRIGAVVLYNRKLTTTERNDLDAWLAAHPSGGIPGAGPTNIAGTRATETDTAQTGSATVGKVVAGTQASETNTPQAGATAAGAVVTGGQADETDTARAGSISFAEIVAGGKATETDTAGAGEVVAGAVVAGGQATEADTAQPGALVEPLTIAGTQATETDTARAGTVLGDEGTPPVASDAANDAHKLTLGGWGVVEWEPAIVPAPFTGVRHSVISAIAYGPVTMQGTQPVFTYSEADRPRLRQRILLGGQDWTYPRGIPTPDVEYELADLLLYGPGSLDIPALMAAWETGTPAAERTTGGRRVKVQLVDDFTDPESPTVEATVYKGFVGNPGVSGPRLVLQLGGEASGRLALRDSHVLFRDVLDISRLIWRELTDVGVRYLPRLGEPGIGIRSRNFDGTSKLEKVEELLARAVKKDGTQRVVLPNPADGVYEITDKDTTTAHFSVFVDDTFTVPDLSSDIAEKPNSIYPTAIAPSGMRIDGAAVPGLISTPAPDYPLLSGNAFGIGTTNEDTDTGDGISVMVNRLGAVGLLDIRDTPGGFDEDVADALNKLGRRARLTGPVDSMFPDLWAALWDLDETGRSGRWSSIQPMAQHTSVQRYLRSASGAVIGLNPDWDPDAIQVDESIDMGSGFRERQVQNWAETRVHAPDGKVWYGTITVNLGAVLAGQVNVGATITAADLVDARLVRPGEHNLWVPNFDGGTLFGVSGAQVSGDSVTFTVDTRHRPAREIWERLQVRRETRNDPARRMLGNRQSTQRKDAVRGFISWGGVVDRDVPLEPGWNVIEVVLGDKGTIAWIDMTVQTVTSDGGTITIDGHEFAVAIFGKPITAARLNDIVPTPLAENGDRPWRRRASRKALNEHGFLVAFGTFEEPCGYGSDLKTDDAPLTGRFIDDAGVTYDCENYTARVCVYVREGAAGAKLLGGRIAWPVLEGGV
jgi:hypothetical protein